MSGALRWIENPRTRKGRFLNLPELVAYRELIVFLAVRDLKVRYKQPAFGLTWAVLQPLVGAAVITFVFRKLAGVPSDGIPYFAYAFLGFVIWSYFTSSLSAVTESLVGNAGLVTKIYFPRLVAPLAAALPGLVDMSVAFVGVAVVMVVLGIAPGLALLTLPIWVAALCLVVLGLGLIFATVNVLYRDALYAYGLIVQLLFFASPLAYPSTLITGGWRYLYHLNPMVAVFDGFRWSVLGGHPPAPQAIISLLSGLLILAAGLRFFTATEPRFADVI
ncbi:MAG: ABC transporter permease [Geodermatophilaceae bacterium]|nr:ABC transporter permease [Geodermatophilaceae bacterium]MDQ3477260.1 ABC transporter permease [Actinomycetota bacterium]